MFGSAAMVALTTALVLAAPATPADCFDGTCTLAVSGPVEVPLDGRAGPTALLVRAVTANSVALSIRGGSGSGSFSMTGVGGRMSFGSEKGTVTARVRAIDQTSGVRTAVLDIVTTVGSA